MAFILAFASLIAVSLGCATLAATAVVTRDNPDFYSKPVLDDEIVAIGRPDAAIKKELGQANVVAFIGLKNTYLLHKGGDDLERISQLKLDGQFMDIDAARSNKLYLKDKQVWGELILTYSSTSVTAEEKAELKKGGFTLSSNPVNQHYQKKVNIEGIVYPALKLSNEQRSKLTTHRPFNLYNSKDAKPPIIGKILMSPLIAVGVVADIALTPVYLGIGVIAIVGGALTH